MKLINIIIIPMCLYGCSLPSAQSGNLYMALKAFDKENYRSCLSRASIAETFDENKSKNLSAQIMFYKSLCLEKMGELAASNGILESLVKRYPDTDWGVAAKHKIDDGAPACK